MALTLWLDALIDIPQVALEQAFAEWERNETHRPTPAHIRRLALSRIEKPEPKRNEGAFVPTVIDAEELARRRQVSQEVGEKLRMPWGRQTKTEP